MDGPTSEHRQQFIEFLREHGAHPVEASKGSRVFATRDGDFFRIDQGAFGPVDVRVGSDGGQIDFRFAGNEIWMSDPDPMRLGGQLATMMAVVEGRAGRSRAKPIVEEVDPRKRFSVEHGIDGRWYLMDRRLGIMLFDEFASEGEARSEAERRNAG